MTKRMLIDATHAEETRVVVLDGNRLEDFDVETSTKKQLKGNIYLAKIVRVEPSLQAAFVEYGGNRHGFLAFGEIHPDYYQIPVADRERLIALQEQEAREAEEAEDAADAAEAEGRSTGRPPRDSDASADTDTDTDTDTNTNTNTNTGADAGAAFGESGNSEPLADSPAAEDTPAPAEAGLGPHTAAARPAAMPVAIRAAATPPDDDLPPEAALLELGFAVDQDGRVSGDPDAMQALHDALARPAPAPEASALSSDDGDADISAGEAGVEEAELGEPAPPPETIGGEAEPAEERERRTPPSRHLRNYKIQEVIRRRQIMLVQVVKEERGGKGAALTTYISLAGRFCVLMPNSPRGGGISRKITSAADRRRLKEITAELGLPTGMGMIVRTAGAARPKPEIVRDCEYLLQLWDDIRETTLKSIAPALIYEEASLIKRAIRDVYSRDVEEVLVDGEPAWRAARDQMRLLMPGHAQKVQIWQDPSGIPLFARHQVDAQLDAMLSPTVQLRSGGYLVINQTEALVAIDVNSGRSTRERGIEETALRTNLEAADEVARQLRLRDLAGLIVIDFIDMESRKHNGMVEKRLKDALKNDRARIQLGTISHFGLMEMSRQRLRPSLAETSFVQCPHCAGTGLVRSTEGAAIHALRAIEEEGGKRRSASVMVFLPGPIAMYILNHKRERLREIESRYGMDVLFTADPNLLPPAIRIERLRTLTQGEAQTVAPAESRAVPVQRIEAPEEDVADLELTEDDAEGEAAETGAASGDAEGGGEAGAGRRRRRRRRRGGRRELDQAGDTARLPGLSLPDLALPDLALPDLALPGAVQPFVDPDAVVPENLPGLAAEGAPAPDHPADGPGEAADGEFGGARRRGRRGGRRRRREFGAAEAGETDHAPPPAYTGPAYTGPTPADPFGGGAAFDIFDVLERAEAAALSQATPAPAPQPEPEPEPEPLPTAEAIPEPLPIPEPELPPPAPVAEAPPAKAPRVRRSRAKAAAVPEPLPAEADVPKAEPAPAEEPAIRPVLVADAPPAPRRGWWKR
jgi:ribonuclease E